MDSPRLARQFACFLGAAGLFLSSSGCELQSASGVAGDLIEFNDNGGWCWYQDERVVVDQTNGKMLIGSVATSEGPDGEFRHGDADITTYDLETGTTERTTLDKIGQDDHAVPAILIRPDGRYLAMYSRHNHDPLSHYRISENPHDSSSWRPEEIFNWKKSGADYNTTYSNLFYLSKEDRTYDFSRGDNRSPNIMTSDDQGDTWDFQGNLTHSKNVGYVNGYFKYASNGVDRIDFIGTEHHPRDYNTGIYHGFIKGGELFRSDGTKVDKDVFDDKAPKPTVLTAVFPGGTVVDKEVMSHAWPCDFAVDSDDRAYAIFSARANDQPENSNFDDHRFFYARFDGTDWHVHQLAKAGSPLFAKEQDYTGLGAVDPSDPNVLYISTAIDPRTEEKTLKHEIYKGVTADEGETWKWTPITWGSTLDNLRPVVPKWDGHHTALLWERGTMKSSQIYDIAIVGIILDE